MLISYTDTIIKSYPALSTYANTVVVFITSASVTVWYNSNTSYGIPCSAIHVAD